MFLACGFSLRDFCISCASPVHNRFAARRKNFPFSCTLPKSLTPRTPPALIQVFLDSHSHQNSADLLFLSCTKNTELTSRRFPRRVSLALTKRKQQFPGPEKQIRRRRQRQPATTGRLAYPEIEFENPDKNKAHEDRRVEDIP